MPESSIRPPVGTRATMQIGDGSILGVTVVPTGSRVPGDEVNVMHDHTGSIQTVPVDRLTITQPVEP